MFFPRSPDSRAGPPASGDHPHTYFILTAAFGSMGDQALASGVVQVAKDRCTSSTILAPGAVEPWHNCGLDVQNLDRWHSPHFRHLAPAARQALTSSGLSVIGADIIDGRYDHGSLALRVRLLNYAAQSGRQASLVNFSLSSAPTRLSTALLRRLHPQVRLWARDSLSRARAEQLLDREVRMAPDIGAFMPASVTPRLTDFLETAVQDRPVALLVPNAHISTDFGAPMEKLRSFWVKLARALAREHHVVLMPHDVRPFPDDRGFVGAIHNELQEHPNPHVSTFTPSDSFEAKGLASRSHLCVASRMHAAVGALSSGTPTVGLDYLQKFAGQFAWYGALGTTVEFTEILSVDRVLDAVSSLECSDPVDRSLDDQTISTSAIEWL